MNTEILKLLENDARLSPKQIATSLSLDVKTVKDESLFGFVHTTWHTLSRGAWLIPYVAIGAYEDLETRKEVTPSYAAFVIRRAFSANGDYRKAGWSKKQVDDITFTG